MFFVIDSNSAYMCILIEYVCLSIRKTPVHNIIMYKSNSYIINTSLQLKMWDFEAQFCIDYFKSESLVTGGGRV